MFGTKHYTVIKLENDPEEYCWGVQHTAYGTVEHKTYSLPNAIMVCRALTEQLDELTVSAVPTLRVVDETIN